LFELTSVVDFFLQILVIQHGAPLLQAPLIQRALPIGQPIAIAHAQPAIAVAKQVEEYDPHPQYNFAYDIQDSLTGDSKNQQESRDGDVVQGQYSLTDPDGYRRTVDYTADPINGFNAVVSRQPLGVVKTAVLAQPAVVAHQPALVAHQPVVTVARNIHSPALISQLGAHY
jgi:hypothetical protein